MGRRLGKVAAGLFFVGIGAIGFLIAFNVIFKPG
jgi:hypothetical protein